MSSHFLDLLLFQAIVNLNSSIFCYQQKSLKFLSKQSHQSEVLSDENILHNNVYITNRASFDDFLLAYSLLATSLENDQQVYIDLPYFYILPSVCVARSPFCII